MKGKRFTDERITYVLGRRRPERRLLPYADSWFSEESFYFWKKKFGKLGMTKIREQRQLRNENARPKRLVAEPTLDKHILGEVVRRALYGQRVSARRPAGFTSDFRWRCADRIDWRCSRPRHGMPKGQARDQSALWLRIRDSVHADPRQRSCASAVQLSAHPLDAQA